MVFFLFFSTYSIKEVTQNSEKNQKVGALRKRAKKIQNLSQKCAVALILVRWVQCPTDKQTENKPTCDNWHDPHLFKSPSVEFFLIDADT